MKYEFNPIEVKPGDFVWIENFIDMSPGERFLAQVVASDYCPDNMVARGYSHGKNWGYVPFELALNSYKGQKRHLFDFTLMPNEDIYNKNVWIASWNPHD